MQVLRDTEALLTAAGCTLGLDSYGTRDAQTIQTYLQLTSPNVWRLVLLDAGCKMLWKGDDAQRDVIVQFVEGHARLVRNLDRVFSVSFSQNFM